MDFLKPKSLRQVLIPLYLCHYHRSPTSLFLLYQQLSLQSKLVFTLFCPNDKRSMLWPTPPKRSSEHRHESHETFPTLKSKSQTLTITLTTLKLFLILALNPLTSLDLLSKIMISPLGNSTIWSMLTTQTIPPTLPSSHTKPSSLPPSEVTNHENGS